MLLHWPNIPGLGKEAAASSFTDHQQHDAEHREQAILSVSTPLKVAQS